MDIINIILFGLLVIKYSETAPSSPTINDNLSRTNLTQIKRLTEWRTVRHDLKDGPKNKLDIIPFIKVNNDVIRIFDRFPDLEDDRQNWGLISEEASHDERNYNRPIQIPMFDEKQYSNNFPKNKQMTREPNRPSFDDPKNKIKPNTQKPVIPPTSCDMAIISCCSGTESRLRDCFTIHECGNLPERNPCSPDVIQKALNKLISFYSS